MSRAHVVALVFLAACAHKAPPPEPVGPGGPLRVSYPPESVRIEGPMPRDVAMNTLDANGRAFASCVTPDAMERAREHPPGHVVIGLRLQVGPEGRVRNAAVTGSNAQNRPIEHCMVHRAKEIQFPNGPAQAPSVVTTMVVVSNP